MKLERITLNNFKCYKYLNFQIPKDNSLTLVTGVNYENTSLGANGVGKTSIMDAICFCLFGKSATKQSSSSLLTLNAKGGYSVQLTFDNHVISRSWNPISRKIDGKEVEQIEIDKLIGLTFDQFLCTVYFNQNGEYFVDLTATEKLNILSSVFELDKWLLYSENAKLKAKAVEKNLLPTTAAYDAKILQKASQMDVKTALEAKKEVYESDKQARLQVLKDELADGERKQQAYLVQVHEEREKVKEKIKEVEKQIKPEINYLDVSEEMKVLKDLVSREEIKEAQALSLINGQNIEIGKAAATLGLYLEQEKNLKEKVGSECPSCMQEVPVVHVDRLVAEIEQKVVILKSQINELHKRNDLSKKTAEDAKLEKAKNQELLTYLNQQMAESGTIALQNEINIKHKKDLEDQLAKTLPVNPYDSYVSSMENQILVASQQENPYSAQLETVVSQIEELESGITSLGEEKKILEKSHVDYEFWQAQFPKIRIAILDEITQELQLHFNQALANLGLMDWHVEIASQKELKDSRIKAELSVNLFHNGQERTIESLSGGERQRIRIASAVGISDLIKDRQGVDWAFQMWDEPSLGLSKEGISSMLEFFENLAQTQQIVIADHRISDYSCFGTILNITKDVKGHSTISQGLPASLAIPIGTI